MHDVTCPCGTVFEARNRRARFCSDACRKRKQRKPGSVVALPGAKAPADDTEKAPADGPGPITQATIAQLAAAGRHTTPLGLVVIALAHRLDFGGRETGSAFSSLVNTFDQKLALAMKGAGAQTAPGALDDELAQRRAKHA